MRDDSKFWIRIWGMIITGVVIISLGISGCTIHQNHKIAEAIKSGVPAEKARIAFSGQVTDTEVAIVNLSSAIEKLEARK